VGIGGNNYFVSFIIGSFYFATSENSWFDSLKGLPPWFTPAMNSDGTYNRYVVEAWYNGLRPNETIPWAMWIVPLLAWGAFFFAAFFMMACLSVMLRAQWGEREALAFPLLRLPLTMTEDVNRPDKYGTLGRFFRNPLMWGGFAVAVLIQTINGLHLYYPDVPRVPLSIDAGPLLREAPWNQIGWVPIQIYPIAVGIAYLLTSEMAFSLWFFYWFFKFQLIAAYLFGFPPGTLPTIMSSGERVFTGYQEVGANLAYAAIIFWAARRHFAHIVRRAVGRVVATDAEKREALPYPVAFWGFLLAFAFMVAWGVAAGMSLLLSLVLWTFYIIIAVVLSRVVAEGGLLFVHHAWMPLGALAQLIGLGPGTLLSPANGIASATFMEAATIQDYRGSLMPSFVQSFKLAYDRGIAGRRLFALLFAVILVGMVVGFSMNVRLGYENSGLALQGWLSKWGPSAAGGNVQTMTTTAKEISGAAWIWTGVGAGLVYGMMLARSYLLWFPLHPLGYLMALTYPAHAFWFSIFLAWIAKTVISRYGGLDSSRKITPLFLGLALGDVAMMLFWLVIDGWQGRTGHQLMPG
jgi:hypothetical protein